MKRKELFNMLFADSEMDVFGCARLSCKSEKCEECKFKGYWEQPVVLSKEVAKIILNCFYGKHDGWTKFPSLHNNIDWSMLKDIIDDALDNGFEVKILNGTIYYREK